ncbi:MAG TPA: STAS domain-containing protein [Spirochaetes bacterium]|nr:STAS domain-containing protein [Spirochaetota bacterium]
MINEGLKYNLEEIEGSKVLHIHGSISSLTRPQLERVVEEITQKSNIILNLSRVPSVTSSGLNVLADLGSSAKKKGKRVLIMGMKPEFIKIIEQMDMYELFIFVETVEEGLLKIRHYT